MKSLYQFIFAGLALVLLWACDANRVFDDYQAIHEKKWHKDSLVVFDIPISDTLQNYNLYVNIRNDIKYNYSNLWLFIEIKQPGSIAIKDTFEVALADPSGNWLGDGIGGLKTRQAIYRRNVFFPRSGKYTITIQQGMREEELAGISDIGCRVEKVN